MDENNLFREAFNRERIALLADGIAAAWPAFDRDGFFTECTKGLGALGYGERADRIERVLERFLPAEYDHAVEILVASLGPEREIGELTGFDGFEIMPMTLFVSRNGLDNPETSLTALYEMTKRFTAEGDIRPFIEKYPDGTLAFLRRLCDDPNPFARRLASEGTRPRLPLAGRLREFQRDPAPVIALLDQLYDDPSEMVRRSVANNINDVSKDNRETAVATVARWRTEHAEGRSRLDERSFERLARHALRTLIKQSDPRALAFFGYETHGLQLDAWSVSTRVVRLGDSLTFSWRMRSTADLPQRLVVNYIVHFLKANGRRTEKVFRLPEKRLPPHSEISIERTHAFRPYRNQRFYDGTHLLEIEINGERRFGTEFELVT